ncbi:potassium transporter Kup [Phenylobacterium sp.]|uniref:potassium transporter Kup n=1 Tax=Phenylobacterium sp. TaxID=1871053 RepID=UPI002FC9CA9A
MSNEQVLAEAGVAHAPADRGHGFWALTLGAIGVVFGDIGTSPLYAMKEALAHAKGGASDLAVFGVVSLIFWALLLIVTLKYVVVVMRADNKGEGGTLALMALAQHATGRRSGWILILGICGAALFYGDGLITPAISVLSATEGLALAPGVGKLFEPYVLPAATVILTGLFLVQARGTAAVGRFFGPITLVWFLVLAGMGLIYIVQEPSILMALSPVHAVRLLVSNGWLGFAVLGSVFLVVTGAEALYADMGHFGKAPIRAGWLMVAFPCLMLNYLGQGALVLIDPSTAESPFFRMIPELAYWPVMILTTMATVIASQAVITGAFSVTQQAVQLGLLPRIAIKRTSETVAGQIYVPAVNGLLLVGVVLLLFMFRSSSNLATAYGIAVTATMVVTVLLMFVIERKLWKWPLAASLAVVVPLLSIDLVFLGSNVLRIAEGGWFPIAVGAAIVLVIWTWMKGARILADKTQRDSIPLADLIETFRHRAPHRVPGAAIYLTSQPEVAPVALMHNLKHNRVLHERNVMLTVQTSDRPRVPEEGRVRVETVSPDFDRITVTYGFMESPNLPRALSAARRQGFRFDIMATSFFLGRRSVVAGAGPGMPLWQDKLFIYLMKNAANPTDYFHIPPGRVVEMGAQVAI